jgi:hypothetical protein
VTQLGIVTTSSETAFSRSQETIYDFVTNPANWTKTYPGSAHITNVPDELPLKVGDTWQESGPTATASSPGIWRSRCAHGCGCSIPLGHSGITMMARAA